MLGMALVKISSQNVNVLQSVKDDINSYASAVINNSNEYRTLKDYISIIDIPKPDVQVEKKNIDLGGFSLISTKEFTLGYNLQHDQIKINNETKSYFRIK
jgi:hypothetical protein